MTSCLVECPCTSLELKASSIGSDKMGRTGVWGGGRVGSDLPPPALTSWTPCSDEVPPATLPDCVLCSGEARGSHRRTLPLWTNATALVAATVALIDLPVPVAQSGLLQPLLPQP